MRLNIQLDPGELATVARAMVAHAAIQSGAADVSDDEGEAPDWGHQFVVSPDAVYTIQYDEGGTVTTSESDGRNIKPGDVIVEDGEAWSTVLIAVKRQPKA